MSFIMRLQKNHRIVDDIDKWMKWRLHDDGDGNQFIMRLEIADIYMHLTTAGDLEAMLITNNLSTIIIISLQYISLWVGDELRAMEFSTDMKKIRFSTKTKIG